MIKACVNTGGLGSIAASGGHNIISTLKFSGKLVVDSNNIWQKLNLRLSMQIKKAVLVKLISKQIENVEIQERF